MNNRFVLASFGALIIGAAPLVYGDDFADDMFRPNFGGYIAATYGTTFDYDITGNDVAGSSDEFRFDLDDNDVYTGALGIYLGKTRIELEASYFENNFDNFGPFTNVLDGELAYLSFMGNMYQDIPTGVPGLEIYLGGGLGFSLIESKGNFTPPILFVDGGGNPVGTLTNTDSDFQTFSIQAMAGLSIEVVENVHLTGGYRYRYFFEASDTSGDGVTFIFGEHGVQTVEVGVRIDF